jgi:hypothetical protein
MNHFLFTVRCNCINLFQLAHLGNFDFFMLGVPCYTYFHDICHLAIVMNVGRSSSFSMWGKILFAHNPMPHPEIPRILYKKG